MSAESSSAGAAAISAATPAVSPAPEETPVGFATSYLAESVTNPGKAAPGETAEETAENGAAATRLRAALPETSASVVCPVCRARFRGAETCSRCGADLGPLLVLTAHAYRLRQRAREHLCQGDFPQALACAEEAERLRSTPHGALLRAVCARLATSK